MPQSKTPTPIARRQLRYLQRRAIRVSLFVGAWIGLNALFGLGSVPLGQGAGQEIAWQAHLGGFLAGLLLFNAFDLSCKK